MKLLNRIIRSLTLRTTLLILTIVVLITSIGNALIIMQVRKNVKKAAYERVEKSMDATLRNIDHRMLNVETAVNTAATYSDDFAHDKQKVYVMLERLLEADPDIAAATLLYSKSYFPEEGEYFAPTAFKLNEGKINMDEIGGPENNFEYLLNDSNWIYTNLHDSAYWCLPYVDSMSTKRPMVTYSVPLREDNGKIYAVLCADVDLQWVCNMIDSYKPHEKSQVSVMSRNGYFICHPDSDNILSIHVYDLIKDEPDSAAITMARNMIKGLKGLDTINTSTLNEKGKSDGGSEKSLVFYAPVERVQWSVSFTYPLNEILRGPNILMWQMAFFSLLMLIIISVAVAYAVSHIVKPIESLAQTADEMALGNITATLPDIRSKDEIRKFRDAFANMQLSLVKHMEDLKRTTEQKASMESELNIAASIQMGMLPKGYPAFPEIKEVDIYGLLKPAKEVGGDLYDYFIRDKKLFFCIGDVSGKGVPASLFMAVLRSLFHNVSLTTDEPDHIVTALNIALSEGNDQNMFCTMFVGVLDITNGHLCYCNAGHNAPVIRRKTESGLCVEYAKPLTNIAVGIFKEFPYQAEEITLKPGEALFLYTDGVTEAENASKELYGEDKLLQALGHARLNNALTTKDFVEAVFGDVTHHAENTLQSDDITMVVVEYKG